MNNRDSYQQIVARARAARKRQRRFQIEILIAVGSICLILGFVAGAAWQYARAGGGQSTPRSEVPAAGESSDQVVTP